MDYSTVDSLSLAGIGVLSIAYLVVNDGCFPETIWVSTLTVQGLEHKCNLRARLFGLENWLFSPALQLGRNKKRKHALSSR